MINHWILFTLSVLFIAGCSAHRIDSFFVDSAALQKTELHSSIKKTIDQKQSIKIDDHFVVTGHRIVNGDGLVIAYRSYYAKFLMPDQSEFQKFTIYLPNSPESQQVINLGEDNGCAFWSKGASNFPGKSGCFGYVTSGTIRIDSISQSEISADINVKIISVSPEGWQKECGSFVFKKNLLLQKRKVESLTPWEGSPGKHVYEESMRE